MATTVTANGAIDAPLPATSTLKNRYEQLARNRYSQLNRARSCAMLTIPTLMPPEGYSTSTVIPSPWQSLGARGVNHLSAKLLMVLFPPNAPFFELSVDPFVLEKMTQQPELLAEINKALAKVERSVMNEIETTALRVGVFEGLKQLIVAGNVTLYLVPAGGVRVFRLDRFVCKRNPMGELIELVIREDISPMELSDAGRSAMYAGSSLNQGTEADDTVEVYTRVYNRNGRCTQYQEVNGHIIQGSIAQYPVDKSPWLCLRWTEVDNEDYGRSFCEEYFGDLRALEGLTKAIVQGSAAASKVLFLVRPNSTTQAKTLSESESGDVKSGHKDDVSVLQMDKYADFKIAFETRQEIKTSLSFAFLLNTAIQRNGERVTAEEIRYMAEELESSLGGVYTALSQTLQRPTVACLMARMQAQGRLPQLPSGIVKVSITTGIEAIGRGNDLNKLKAFVADLAQFAQGAQVLEPYMNLNNLITRLGTGYGIDTEGLVNDPATTAQILQQRQQQAMTAQMAPHLIKGGADIAKQTMVNQQQGGK